MNIRQSEKMKGFTRKERETLDENQTIRKKERFHWKGKRTLEHRNLVLLAFYSERE